MYFESLVVSEPTERTVLPRYLSTVAAGLPSPADDYVDERIDIAELLIQHPAETFICRAAGDSMEGAGIYNGDYLIVDKSLEAKHGDVVVAAVAGELTCKYLDKHRHRLLPANERYRPIEIPEGSDLVLEGVGGYKNNCVSGSSL